MPIPRKCASVLALALHVLRIGAYFGLGIAAILLSLLFFHQVLFRLVASAIPTSRSFFYDLAVWGAYRTTTFVSFPLPAPHGAFVRWDDRCDNGHMFLATDGKSVDRQGPVILDSRGDLVWMSADFNISMNLRVQHYDGNDYLTFWSGSKNGSRGYGRGVMLDSSYNVFREVEAVGPGLAADLHEFHITDDGTALLTIYNVTNMDLRPMGWGRPKHGWVEDCVFQEIDLATGDLLFQWRARDHFHPEDTYYWHPLAGYSEPITMDYYHINSVQKDSRGNYLVSSRHFHHILYIDGTTGDILWILGGRPEQNDFKDLSDGAATGFQWQHHARWFSEEDSILTVFDNGNAGPLHVDAPYSKGLLIQLDLNQSTAAVLQEYVSIGKAKAASMGSVDHLPNGNMLIGWGSSAAWSEHSMDGTLLCEWHFAAAMSFWWERVKNYRAFKYHGWVGKPQWPPSTKIQDGRLYVSWNGATEVRFWELQGSKNPLSTSDVDSADFTRIQVVDKQGFETSFAIPPEGDFSHFRVAALDAQKQPLTFSEPVLAGVGTSTTASAGMFLGTIACALTLLCALYIFWAWLRRRKPGESSHWQPPVGLLGGQHRYSKL